MTFLLPDYIEKIRMVKRPIAVPYNYRIMYKLAQIALIMAHCCGRKGCSMQKLQMISASLLSKDELDKLLAFVNGKLEYPIIRYDPSINRAISFALAEGLINKQVNGLLRLTAKGKTFTSELMKDNQMLIIEKIALKEIAEKLTEEKISSVLADWRSFDVQN